MALMFETYLGLMGCVKSLHPMVSKVGYQSSNMRSTSEEMNQSIAVNTRTSHPFQGPDNESVRLKVKVGRKAVVKYDEYEIYAKKRFHQFHPSTRKINPAGPGARCQAAASTHSASRQTI